MTAVRVCPLLTARTTAKQMLPTATNAPPKSWSRICARAQTAERGRTAWGAGRTWERVLRYPGGQERRIRYPEPQILEEEEVLAATESSDNDWWGIESYYYELSSDEEDDTARTQKQEAASTSGRDGCTAIQSTSKPATQQGLPSTPDELLRYISSDEYKAAQAEQLQLVRSSYQVLEGSPWVQSKPVYVLATQQHGVEVAGLTYTLRTRVQRKDAEDEATKVLGRTRPDGSALIRVEELRDGVVAFEDEADAQRFASLLEADGTEAMVAECDGHAVFRETRAVRAVVVLVQACSGLNCHLPMPEELASALRGQRSLEDPADI